MTVQAQLEKNSTGAALFDPVNLKVVYLSHDETNALLLKQPPLIFELKRLGFFGEAHETPVLYRQGKYENVKIPPLTDQHNYAFAVQKKITDGYATNGDVNRLSGFRIVVTDRCNMACRYCFVDTNTGSKDITVEELDEGFDLLFSMNEGREVVNYQWFGGEPLMRRDLIVQADQNAREAAAAHGIEIRPTVVTNGTILNDKLLKHFKEFKYGVGVSLDGPPDINAVERRFLSGKKTEDVIEKNIQLLLEENIHVGVNITPTAKNFRTIKDTVDYILDLGIRFIYVNSPIPICGYWVDDGAKWAEVLFESRLYALSKGAMLFSHLDRIYQAIDSRSIRVYEHLQQCGGLNAALLPGGRLSVLDLNWRNQNFIFTIKQIREDPTLLTTARKKLHPIKECESCEAAGICGGPSINDRLLTGQDIPTPEYCRFFKRAISLAVFDTTGLQ